MGLPSGRPSPKTCRSIISSRTILQDHITGDRGTQSILGWYKDDSRYGLPVTDSHFQINSTNSTVPIINKDGGGNTYLLTSL